MGVPVPAGITTNITPAAGVPANAMRRLMGAMAALERAGEVAANNAANVDAAGFKQQISYSRSVLGGIPTGHAAVDWRPGTMRITGQPLDLALTGQGFLVIGTAQGPRLSRGGSFQLDGDRRLIAASGEPLLAEPNVGAVGEDGVVRIPDTAGQLEMLSDGRVLWTPTAPAGEPTVGPQILGRLRLERPANLADLQAEAGGRWRPTAPTVAMTGEARRLLRSGVLEDSNTNAIETMAAMIETHRKYGSVQQAASMIDQIRGLAASELAKPPGM